ncbi:unnamed protein product, partial [Medioppia subpectinata]
IVDYLGPKIRILVTHQIQFIRKATKILVLDDGKCLALGTFDELLAKGLDFMALIDGTDNDNNNGGDNEREGVVGVVGGGEGVMGMFEGQMSAGNAPDVVSPRFGSISRASLNVPTGNTSSVRRGSTLARRRASSIRPRKSMVELEAPHIEEELQTQGSIGGRVYWLYVKAGCGLFMGTVTLVFTFLSQALFHASDIWLLVWASLSETGQFTTEKNQLYVIIYAVLIAALLLATIVRVLTWYRICLKAAKTLHNRVFTTLFRAPMAVFDSNPIGRIMNRFSKDVSAIDEVLPNVLYEVNLGVSLIVFTIIVAALVNYYLVIPGVIVLILSVFVRNIYIKTARDIKRMEGLTRSPVLSHVSATLRGLASIRAYGAQQAFRNQFYKYQDDHSATWFIYLAAARTLGITIDWLCVIYFIVVAVVIIALNYGGVTTSAFADIQAVLMLINYTQYGVRQSAEMESHMTSVERIIEYTKLPQEADLLSTQHNTPDPQWPQTGGIVLDHMSLIYDSAPDKPVLKDITCEIRGGEKIGIVGRTGAGKSSVISALFRMVEPTGRIVIDGVDTKRIGLHDLRRALAIIPQEPVVFSGTIRSNLDPFSEHSDTDIWSALESVQLQDVVSAITGGLDASLSGGGIEFSAGQRQLVCLARAILRHNRVLVLDEATANVDHQTDALIQRII